MSPVDYILLFTTIVGPVGSIVERLGMALDRPAVVRVGRVLESLGVDLPKLFLPKK